MKLEKWLEPWDLIKLEINAGFLKMEWNPQTADKDAAWDLYFELLTRITTQPLPDTHGDEKAALESVYQLFPLTRAVLLRHGRGCVNFFKIAVVVLNQIVRPFTTEWHRAALKGAFDDPEKCKRFRHELSAKQQQLRQYASMLAAMAGVEDLTEIEKTD